MMTILIALVTIGVIDMLDPYGVATILMLLQLVKKERHALVYVWSSYLTYWVVAVTFYYGAHLFLYHRLIHLVESYPRQTLWFIMLFSIAIFFVAIVLGIRVIRNWDVVDRDISKVLFIKSVHPFFILVLGVGGTLANMPSAWTMVAFVGILLPFKLTFGSIVVILGIFTLFSIIPIQTVYLLYRVMETSRFARVMAVSKKYLSRMCVASIPVFLLVISFAGFTHSLYRIGVFK